MVSILRRNRQWACDHVAKNKTSGNLQVNILFLPWLYSLSSLSENPLKRSSEHTGSLLPQVLKFLSKKSNILKWKLNRLKLP